MLDLRKIIFIVLLTAIGLGYWQYTRMEKKVDVAQKEATHEKVIGQVNKDALDKGNKSDIVDNKAINNVIDNTNKVRNDQDGIKLKADSELRKLDSKPVTVIKKPKDNKVKDSTDLTSPTSDNSNPQITYDENTNKKSKIYIDSLWEAYESGNASVNAKKI